MKKTKVLFILLLTLILFNEKSIDAKDVPFTIESSFGHLYGGSNNDSLENAFKTKDGSYILVGSSISNTSGDLTDSNNGSDDGLIVKFDKNGNEVWQNLYGGNQSDYFFDATELSDGSYIAVGESTSSKNGEITDSNNSDYSALLPTDGLIVKFDKDGNIIFDNLFGSSLADGFHSVTATSDGGFIAVGYDGGFGVGTDIVAPDHDITDSNNGKKDGLISKFDKDGNLLFMNSFGGDGNDSLIDVIETSDGGFVTVGTSESYKGEIGESSKGFEDALISKFDKNGNKLWSHLFGSNKTDSFNSIIEIANGNLVAVGSSENTNYTDVSNPYKGMFDGIIVSYDKNGKLLWDKNVGGDSNSTTELNDIIESSNGNLIISGSYKNKTGLPSEDISSTPLKKDGVDGLHMTLDKDGNYIKDYLVGGSGSDSIKSVLELNTNEFLTFSNSSSTDGNISSASKGKQDFLVNLLKYKTNEKPILNGITDKTISIGETVDSLKGVSATDYEDGDLTSKISVTESYDNTTPGDYFISYQVYDSDGNYDFKNSNIKVVDTVVSNTPPIISGADDITINVGDEFDDRLGVKALDQEDGDLTDKMKVFSKIPRTLSEGVYDIKYSVEDSDGNKTEVIRKVTVLPKGSSNNKPILDGVTDKTIKLGEYFNSMEGVYSKDVEDGDLTNKIIINYNDLDNTKVGTYKITYTVSDSDLNTVEKSRTIKVIDNSKLIPEDKENDSNDKLIRTGLDYNLFFINILLISTLIILKLNKKTN